MIEVKELTKKKDEYKFRDLQNIVFIIELQNLLNYILI